MLLKKLPENFELDKYGLHARLVNEDDAEFILKLRTDPKLTQYIHDTDPDVEKQKLWIRNYKIREKEGREYYFIFSFKDVSCGVTRLYDIREDGFFNAGSWVFGPTMHKLASFAAACIVYELAFNELRLSCCFMSDGVHSENKSVLNFNKAIGAKIQGTVRDDKGLYYQLSIGKEDFFLCERRWVGILNRFSN